MMQLWKVNSNPEFNMVFSLHFKNELFETAISEKWC